MGSLHDCIGFTRPQATFWNMYDCVMGCQLPRALQRIIAPFTTSGRVHCFFPVHVSGASLQPLVYMEHIWGQGCVHDMFFSLTLCFMYQFTLCTLVVNLLNTCRLLVGYLFYICWTLLGQIKVDSAGVSCSLARPQVHFDYCLRGTMQSLLLRITGAAGKPVNIVSVN